jgi:2-polyprenyl-3-methyl-5-hydroxy-6-metoxy-1,4-benzoquinol methylase
MMAPMNSNNRDRMPRKGGSRAGHRPNAPPPPPPRTPPAGPAAPAAPKLTHWGQVADWYDDLVGEQGSEYHREVIIPGILRMLGLKEDRPEKSPLPVLDLACGQGVLCRRLAGAGCQVTGLDAAEPLIAAAQRREAEQPLGLRYLVADATRLLDDSGTPSLPLAADSFGAITLVLAIQNMTPLSPVWQACKTLLKPGGVLILVMMHPCFRVPKQSDWVWQEGEGAQMGSGSQGRVVRQYLTSTKVEIQTHPGLAAHGRDSASTTHFHRPLQAYINTLGNAGLLIDHVEEWISHKSSQAGPRKAALDRARKEIPMFLAIRARKV